MKKVIKERKEGKDGREGKKEIKREAKEEKEGKKERKERKGRKGSEKKLYINVILDAKVDSSRDMYAFSRGFFTEGGWGTKRPGDGFCVICDSSAS